MHSEQLNRLYQQLSFLDANGYQQRFSHRDTYIRGGSQNSVKSMGSSQTTRVQILTPHPDISITLVNESMFIAISRL